MTHEYMTPEDIQRIVKLTVSETLRSMGVKPRLMSANKAYITYGRGAVNRWHKEGWIKPVQDEPGTRWRYATSELEVCAEQNNALKKYMKTPKTK